MSLRSLSNFLSITTKVHLGTSSVPKYSVNPKTFRNRITEGWNPWIESRSRRHKAKCKITNYSEVLRVFLTSLRLLLTTIYFFLSSVFLILFSTRTLFHLLSCQKVESNSHFETRKKNHRMVNTELFFFKRLVPKGQKHTSEQGSFSKGGFRKVG